MFFVTNEPLIFSTETGLLWGISVPDDNGVCGVAMRSIEAMAANEAVAYVYTGTEQQCEDFIFGMAGRLGAFNPEKDGGE